MSIGPYQSAADMRRAVNARIRAEARRRDRPPAALRREVAYQQMLARIFSADQTNWVLKGGVGLLVRFPSARHSLDVDLIHAQTLDDGLAGLRSAATLDLEDGLAFDVGRTTIMSGGTVGARVAVASRIGATLFQGFTIDLITGRQFPRGVEFTTPTPVIDLDHFPALPPFVLYPLTAQIADKVCAIFDTYNGAPSTRYRDLVDLVLIAINQTVRGPDLIASITHEADRRAITLPHAFHLPGVSWRDGYRKARQATSLPLKFSTADQAIELMQAFLDPILQEDSVGTWSTDDLCWRG